MSCNDSIHFGFLPTKSITIGKSMRASVEMIDVCERKGEKEREERERKNTFVLLSCQMIHVASLLAEAKYFPVGENLTNHTSSVC
jgi:hypothetical protein